MKRRAQQSSLMPREHEQPTRCRLCEREVMQTTRHHLIPRSKGGREVVARCPSEADGQEAAAWLVDRISRLRPGLVVTAEVEPGGGQYLLVLRA